MKLSAARRRWIWRMGQRTFIPLAATLLLGLSACAATGEYIGSEASAARTASDARTSASDGRTNSSPARTNCEMSPPTVRHPLVVGATLPTSPNQPAGTAMAVMFSLSDVDPNTYIVQLVDINGKAVASARAYLRSPITGTCGNDTRSSRTMPLISTSAGRVYYLDGDTDVRYLTPDGSTGLATRLSGSSQSVAMFAVSPNDSMIAVSLFDFRRHPVGSSVFVQGMDGSHRIDIPEIGGRYLWPVGWHGGSVLLGSSTLANNPTFGSYSPLPGGLVLQLLDPTTGSVTKLGGHDCQPTPALPSPGGIACATPSLGVGRIDWRGGMTIFATGDAFTGGASLSPDGTQLLASGTGALLKLIDAPELGSRETTLGTTYPQGGGYPTDGGWLDAFHVVYRVAGTPSQVILDVRSQTVVSLPPATVLAARLPGGY